MCWCHIFPPFVIQKERESELEKNFITTGCFKETLFWKLNNITSQLESFKEILFDFCQTCCLKKTFECCLVAVRRHNERIPLRRNSYSKRVFFKCTVCYQMVAYCYQNTLA